MNQNTYKNIIDKCFSITYNSTIPTSVSNLTEICQKIFILESSNQTTEIPIFGKIIDNNFIYSDKIVVGVKMIDMVYNVRNIDGLIKEAFSNTSILTLKKFKIKEEIYYAGKGLILDSHFEPILTFISISRMESFKCYIDPSVFTTHNKSLMAKYITKKLIPYLINNNIKYDYKNYKCDLTIDKINYIHSPVIPYNFSNEDINKMILENIDDLYDCLK